MFISNNSIVLSSKKEDVERSGFEFQKLPYSYDFLEPVIDAETMKIHHTKHQKKYFDNMMEIIDSSKRYHKYSIVELMSDLDKIPSKDREKFKNNAGGYFNHAFFWNVMTTDKTPYVGPIRTLIDKKFGSLDKFKLEFIKTGMDHFGSGWIWLCTEDGTDLKKISHDKGFDAFPLFSPNGKKIIFSSNRFNGGTRDTNVFIADWVE